MPRTKIAGVGMYVPENVYTNFELMRFMDTTDEWIQKNTGIVERRFANRYGETTATMGVKAAEKAIENAGITKDDVDFIIFATLSADYLFPGCGVLVQRAMQLKNIGALDIRNQCSGFIYGLSVADQFIKSGMYKNILLIGSEKHSFALDFSNTGRTPASIFGDGAGAVVLQPTEEEGKGVLSTHLHCDGTGSDALAGYNPGTHSNYWVETPVAEYEEAEIGKQFMSHAMVEKGMFYPHMEGSIVMKKGIVRLPEVINEALSTNNYTPADLNMLILNQSNLRIAEFVQNKFHLKDENVHNNIQKYGNTTAASIPIALHEALELGKIKNGDLVCFASFGSGLTWASALVRW